MALGATPNTDGVLLRGYARNSGFTITSGARLFLSSVTAGAIVSSPPTTGPDTWQIVLGYSIKNISLNTYYFNPDTNEIENS